MRKRSAHYVFPVCRPPLRHGIVVTDEEGVIREVTDPGEEIREIARTVFYNGILVPGFVIFLQLPEAEVQGEEIKRWRKALGKAGCRGAVVAGHDRIIRLDMFSGEETETEAVEAERLRERMVVITKETGEGIGVEDLFPPHEEGTERGRILFEERLRALTLAGAEALEMKEAGCLAPGYRPGVVALEMDFERWKVKA